jgi:peroxiredoxin family protein
MIKTLKETELVKFYACSASLSIMEIEMDELFGIDGIMGLSTFLNKVEKASIVLYI